MNWETGTPDFECFIPAGASKYAKAAQVKVTPQGTEFHGLINGKHHAIGLETAITIDARSFEIVADSFAKAENAAAIEAHSKRMRELSGTELRRYEINGGADVFRAIRCDADWWKVAFERAHRAYCIEECKAQEADAYIKAENAKVAA